MTRPVTLVLKLLSAAAIGLLPGCARANRVELVLVTTTSVGNSGLLDALLPVYEQTAGVRFGVHLAGSGRALVMLGDGDGDVAISHAPEAEAKALAGHPRWWYRKIMYNDFVLVARRSASPEHVRRHRQPRSSRYRSRRDVVWPLAERWGRAQWHRVLQDGWDAGVSPLAPRPSA